MSNRKVKITAKDFAAKMRSKQEVYHFLTNELGGYLSHPDTMTVWHMRDLVSGKRRRLKDKDIKHLSAPQYEGLKLETFFEWAAKEDAINPGSRPIMDAFPLELGEREKLPRQYVLNVIYTISGQRFRSWVDEQVKRRHQEIAEQRQMYIELDEEVAQAFQQSQAVSTSNGQSYNLMTSSAKRRRSKKQIEEEKKQEERQQAEIARKIARFDEMEAQVNEMKEKVEKVDMAGDALLNLKKAGLVKQTGDNDYELV